MSKSASITFRLEKNDKVEIQKEMNRLQIKSMSELIRLLWLRYKGQR